MLKPFLAAAASVAFAVPAWGTVTVDVSTSTDGSSVANSLNVTTTSYEWNGAELFVELTQGSVINLASGSGGVDTAPSQAQIDLFPALLFDTWVGRVGKSDTLSGSAIELGGADTLSIGPSGISVSWLGSRNTHPPSSNLPIGNIVFSDDAQGTWSLAVSEPYLKTVTYAGGTLANGVLLTDFVPGDLNVDGYTGVEDLNIVLGQWNTDGSGDTRSDPTGDGYVGINDLNEVLGGWNQGALQEPWPEGIDPDLNGDGFVGLSELNIVLGNWHQNVTPGDVSLGDPSGDGFVGFDDIIIINTLWNAGTPPVALVPEPAGLALFSLGALSLLKRRSIRA